MNKMSTSVSYAVIWKTWCYHWTLTNMYSFTMVVEPNVVATISSPEGHYRVMEERDVRFLEDSSIDSATEVLIWQKKIGKHELVWKCWRFLASFVRSKVLHSDRSGTNFASVYVLPPVFQWDMYSTTLKEYFSRLWKYSEKDARHALVYLRLLSWLTISAL